MVPPALLINTIVKRGYLMGSRVGGVELLSELITLNAATSLNYSSYSRMVRASVESIQRWIVLLEQLSYCFTVRPWTKNISRSIIKEPKIYLTDWAGRFHFLNGWTRQQHLESLRLRRSSMTRS